MFKLQKLHLVNPATGQRKWYLGTSPMVFCFAFLLFPLITRRLWVWLAVWVVYDLLAILVVIAETQMTADNSQALDSVLRVIVLALGLWTAIVANKQATRKLLARGWMVSSETTAEEWASFQKRWKLPGFVRQNVEAQAVPPSPAGLSPNSA